MIKQWMPGVIVALLLSGCNAYEPKSNDAAHNTLKPVEVVKLHLRAVENGDWETANSYLADDYRMKMEGMPFFVRIGKPDALAMHIARKQAFPDFKFNEQVEMEKDNEVKLAIYLTGTHTGILDYPKNVGVPKTPATGKSIHLPSEYFTYAVENNKIVYTYGMIPEGHGPKALMEQLGIQAN
ncbi:MAG: ester cyclase [Chitinophagales bacterium]